VAVNITAVEPDGEVVQISVEVDVMETEGTKVGFTATVIVYGVPEQLPEVAVGVTIYSTVPAVELLGLVSVWSIVNPDDALAPVIPPVIVPMVQENELAEEAVNEISRLAPLHMVAVFVVVTAGFGFTVTVIL
jgi:hypothetical protein